MIFSKNRRDLNLIPEEERTLKTRRNRRLIAAFVVLVLLAEVAVFAAVSFLQISEQSRQQDIARQTSQKNAQWQKIASVAATAKGIKTDINLLGSFPKKYFGVEDALAKIKEVIPTRVKLTALDADSTGKVNLTGNTADPANILQLFNTLQEKTTLFGSVRLESVNKVS